MAADGLSFCQANLMNSIRALVVALATAALCHCISPSQTALERVEIYALDWNVSPFAGSTMKNAESMWHLTSVMKDRVDLFCKSLDKQGDPVQFRNQHVKLKVVRGHDVYYMNRYGEVWKNGKEYTLPVDEQENIKLYLYVFTPKFTDPQGP